jgi:hypothetical protein
MNHLTTPAATRTAGRLHAWRVRWLGDRDPVETQLADIARQAPVWPTWRTSALRPY